MILPNHITVSIVHDIAVSMLSDITVFKDKLSQILYHMISEFLVQDIAHISHLLYVFNQESSQLCERSHILV